MPRRGPLLASPREHLDRPFRPRVHLPAPGQPGSAAGVRRHQSLNYPNATGVRSRLNNTGLKRAGTLQAPPLKGHPQQGLYSGAQSPSPTGAEEEYEYDNDSVRAEEEGGYFRMSSQQGQSQYPTSPIGRSSAWSTPGAGNDWRTQLGGNGNTTIGAGAGGIDDVTRALNTLEINQQYGGTNNYQQGRNRTPASCMPCTNLVCQVPGLRNGGMSAANARKLQLVTDLDSQVPQGSIQSASAYVPPIGHGMQQSRQNERDEQPSHHHRDRSFTASGSGPWDPKAGL